MYRKGSSPCSCSKRRHSISKPLFHKLASQIYIPLSVKFIESYAFGTCSKLEIITIPSSVTNLGDYVFALCLKAYASVQIS
ncbi:leucine-rich repeat protein [Terrisporobacter vanillatitrophus]|uniref:leucine-rich repeat protein n=1 Tax=Terrisporobacter vanillatitrophus TaxID=3058402 RepID=UPI003EBEEF5A